MGAHTHLLHILPLVLSLLHLLVIVDGAAFSRSLRSSSPTELSQKTIIYLPLDERFTTRDAFLNLALTTPFQILTPPVDLLSFMKTPCNLSALLDWVDQNIVYADYAVFSAEMYLYGGLIASRISNDSMENVFDRLQRFLNLKKSHPNVVFLISSVVMRIPAYNGDTEEPWYWANFGQLLFEYSYFMDRYEVLGNESDLVLAKDYVSQVPQNALREFLWRRSRNHNVSVSMLNTLGSDPSMFYRCYITLDDNAQFGFNIAESLELKQQAESLHLLGEQVQIYPGADEVGLTLLAGVGCLDTNRGVSFQLVFRDPTTIYNIPSYEGQPMIYTIQDQIKAAGGVIVNSSDADVFLLVNNFSEEQQIEAPIQPLANRSIADYAMFVPYIATSKVLGMADNRYCNGADIIFVQWLFYQAQNGTPALSLNRFTYAGWNTDGNTLGTVIANSVLLALYNQSKENTFFNALRILEDNFYQAQVRQDLSYYISLVQGDSISNITDPFYTTFVFKPLQSYMETICSIWDLPWHLTSVYFPWLRTFEIGLLAQ